MRSLALTLALLLAPSAAAQSAPDSSFADGGFALLETDASSFAVAVAPRPGGGVFAGGTWTTSEGRLGVAAFTASGALDPAYGDGGVVRLPSAWRTAVQRVVPFEDGSVLLVSQQSYSSAYRRLQVVRLLPGGTIDHAFGSSGVLFVSIPNALGDVAVADAVRDGDAALIAGTASANGTTTHFVTRVGPAGLDTTYGDGGSTLVPEAGRLSGLSRDAQGRTLVVGRTPDGETPGILAWRLEADGQYDPDFKPAALRIDKVSTYPGGIAALTDGRVVLTGASLSSTDISTTGVWALTDEGVLDTSFGDGGRTTVDVYGLDDASERETARAPIALTEGAVGVVVDANSTEGVRWLVLRADGTPDTANGPDGVARLFSDRFETQTLATATSDGSAVYVGGLLLRKRPDQNGFQNDLWVARFSAKPSPVSAGSSPADRPVLALRTAPNPTADRLTVGLRTDASADVTLSVYDVLGRHVATLWDGPAAAGELRTTWDARSATPGVYLVRARAGDTVTVRTVTVVP